MKPTQLKPTTVADTPRRRRPELFGACQVRQGRPTYAAA